MLELISKINLTVYQIHVKGKSIIEEVLTMTVKCVKNHLAYFMTKSEKEIRAFVVKALSHFHEEDQLLMKAMVLENSMFQDMELIRVDPIACPVIVISVGDMIFKYAEAPPCLKLFL
jgi:hypothetical protein